MLDIALKEWAVVCDLMLEGELAILLRKGGIMEAGGPGRFELEHPRFLLFPAWMHQDPARIKPAYRERVVIHDEEPAQVMLRGMGRVDHIWQVPDREAFDRLEDLHCWTEPQIDMRFHYKPKRPLYLMAVRAYRLDEPRVIANSPAYAGCRSWVELDRGDAVDVSRARPVLEDVTFERIMGRIDQTWHEAARDSFGGSRYMEG